jgi:hypothetical protein
MTATRKPSAVDRTLPLFDPLDTTRVAGSKVDLDGPTIFVVVLEPKPEHATTLSGCQTTHYQLEYGSEGRTLCGDSLLRLADHGQRGKLCGGCRIEASRLKAVLR